MVHRSLFSGARARAFAVVTLVGLAAVVALTSGCGATPQTPAAPADQAASQAAAPAQSQVSWPSTPTASKPTPKTTKLIIQDVQVGTGPAAKAGDSVSVDYTGMLADGTQFDSSVGKQPFDFVLGGGTVIAGWDNGLVGMKVGGQRRLIIPPDQGYGAQGSPPVIPGNAVLVFDVTLLGIN
jgi:FKBP-type peptidyl-prolyl cis-trans isomerase